MGTIVGISDVDPLRWPGSKWRNIQVQSVLLKFYEAYCILELMLIGNNWHNDFSANRWSGMSQGVLINRIELVFGRLRLLKAFLSFLL